MMIRYFLEPNTLISKGQRLTTAPVALFAVVLVFPTIFASDFALRFLAEILIFGIAVMGLDILVGFGGLISLGHAALFGGAAYSAALVAQRFGGDLFLMLAVGVGTGTLLAILIGAVVVRTANLFFLILTLVAGQIVWELVFHARDLTGGADGLRGLPPLQLNLGIGTLPLNSALGLYFSVASVALLAFVAVNSFIRAPVGRALVGSREQALRMSALGYSVPVVRFRALVAAGAIAGAAGALYPFVNQYIGPSAVHWSTSAMMIIMLVIGGVGSIYGAFIGAGIYLGIQNYVSSYTDRWQLFVGLVFMLTVLLMPSGIASTLTAAVRRLGISKGGRDA